MKEPQTTRLDEICDWLSSLHKRFPVEDFRGGFYKLEDAKSCEDAENVIKRISDVKKLIRSTLDVPTFIDAKANCHNLTKTLQEVERLLS